MLEGGLKDDLLHIYLIKFSGGGNSGDRSAFFGKCLKFNIEFEKLKKNSGRMFYF